ncbi:MAG: hypothetical protein IKJ04_08525, partial [Clostridia bacterium]|nr:hypothetical protein [Clostridia bacterium]
VSLRLGHAADLTVPRTVIQYRVAATLREPEGGVKVRELLCPVFGKKQKQRESLLKLFKACGARGRASY